MENPSKNIKTAQEIKSLLQKKLGVIYSLPEYFFQKGCKAQLMFDTEDLKEKYPNLNLHESYSIYTINDKDAEDYTVDTLDATCNNPLNEEEKQQEHNTVAPKEDIYRIITDLMRDDFNDELSDLEEPASTPSTLDPPKSFKDLLSILYALPDCPAQTSEEMTTIFYGDSPSSEVTTTLPIDLAKYLGNSIHTNHPNILPLKALVHSAPHYFAIADYNQSTIATIQKYNKHLLQAPIVRLFIAYQAIQVLYFLHSHGIPCPRFSTDSLILTENLWLLLPLPALQKIHYPVATPHQQLSMITEAWVNGRLTNFDYVMYLNDAAGRRMDDSNFHCIMPWVCDFSSQTGGWRDFSISKFRMNKGDDQLDVSYEHSVPKHHISESLSELTYAIYMARCMPISLLRVVVRSNFQSKEYPGNMMRMFEWTPDECIPEYFTDPSVFKSIHSNMDDMELPEWCPEPESFIQWHRSMLESDYVSNHLHLWINLNFGYQLSGQAAVEAKNVPLVQDSINGLTKNPGFVQLFTQPHPQRMRNGKDEPSRYPFIFMVFDPSPAITHLPASHVRGVRQSQPTVEAPSLNAASEVVMNPQPPVAQPSQPVEASQPEEVHLADKEVKRTRKNRKLSIFFSGNAKELLEPLPPTSLTPESSVSSLNKVETPMPRESLKLQGHIAIEFKQTRENLMQNNGFATESFSRAYEYILQPCYLAPEELEGQSLSLQQMMKADLFRLGCVLFELFTGHSLFTENTLREYVSDSTSTRARLNVLNEPVRSLVEQLIAVDPSKRPSAEKLARNELIVCSSGEGLHVKPSLTLFPASLAKIYEVCSYYYLTPTTLHAEDSMRSLTETLSSLTVDELPLILPLLQRINQDIAIYPTLPSLPRVFIALWNQIASSLHEEQVAEMLLTTLSQLLDQSLQAHNFLPLETLCDRATLSRLFHNLGPKQFLKLMLPPMMELLLSNQTPTSMSNCLVDAITFLSSPRLLGAALTTRYLLPTLTVKTGNITFKRTDMMQPWPQNTSLVPSLSPASRALIGVLGYVTPEALVSITLAHLFPKAYSLLALLQPSTSTPTLKSIQAAVCISEIIEVVRALLPFFSPKLFLYNVIQRAPPRLGDLLPSLYFPVASDDACLIYANATLIAAVINLYYDVASRIDAKAQTDYMTNDLRVFFSRFHHFYMPALSATNGSDNGDEENAMDPAQDPNQAIYKAILLKIKTDSIFQKQRINPSLSMYSFDLLELLRETEFASPTTLSPSFSPPSFTYSTSIAPPADYKSNLAKNLTSRCWAAANNIHMVGGSAGFLNNRTDFDTPITLTNQVKHTVRAYEGCLYGIVSRGNEAIFGTVGNELLGGQAVPVIKLWKSDRRPLAAFASFRGHTSFVHSLQFLPSAPLLASCSDKLCVYDIHKQQLLTQCAAENTAFSCMASSAVSITAKGVNGSAAWQQLYCATKANEVVCYDVRQKFYDVKVSARFPFAVRQVPRSPAEVSLICAIATFSDEMFAIAWNCGIIEVFQQRVATPLFQWCAHACHIVKLTFLGRSKLLSAGVDGSVFVWNLGDAKPSLFAKLTGLATIGSAYGLSVMEYGSEPGIMYANGDAVFTCNDLDVREYVNVAEAAPQVLTMNPSVLCDGITTKPLNNLKLCANAACPLRRIALCGSESGNLYVVQ